MRKKPKYFYATIATAVVASSVTTVAPTETQAKTTTFPDVKSTSYYYDSVMSLLKRNIIHGYPNGNFGPNDYITRAQAAKIIAGVLGLDTKNVKNPKFKDVNTNHPYYGVIAALQNEGIINGTGNGHFSPNDPIKRNHMAKIISIAFDIKASNNSLLPFKDVSRLYEDYIAGLYEYGITSGTTSTTFAGDLSVTRGELAAFIHRAEDVGQEVTIESLSKNGIQTKSGNYSIDSSLYSIFNSTNAEALKGAVVKATIKNGKIIKVSSITLNNSGTASQAVILDGAGATLEGNIVVNADNIQLKNLKVNGQIKLTNIVTNGFTAEKVESTGELVIEEGKSSPVASLNLLVANTSTGPKVELKQSKVSGVDTKRDHVQLNSDTKIPYVNVSALVSSIEINSDVDKVSVDVSVNIEIKGSGNITELSVDQASEIALNIAGDIKKLLVENKNSKVEVGVNLSINQLIVPNGSEAASMVKNFDSIKHKIEVIFNNNGQVVQQPGNNTSEGNQDSGENYFNLSIIHTNDTHANLANAPKRATIINNVRKEKPNALLLDAGDVFQGTLYFTEYKGQADLALMNYMGYDAMTLGNHEFDLGKTNEGHQALVDFIKGARFPILTYNVDFSADEKFDGLYKEGITKEATAGNIYDGMIIEVDGEQVGIFGLTTETTAGSSSPEKVVFENYIEEAEKAVELLEEQGVDKIIALTHLGFNNPTDSNDLLLAEHVEGIDIIVGGHSHTTLTETNVVDANGTPTVIVQTGSNSANVGTLDVEFDKNGVVVKYENELIKISSDIEDDPEAAKILEQYTEGIAELENKETGGSTKNEIENPRLGDQDNTGISVRNNETALGNLVADSMLSEGKKIAPKATIALQNGGGVRNSVDAGPITMGDVLKVLSFNNGLYSVELTGAELRRALEGGVAAKLHESGKYLQESGSFLHVAGLKFKYDRTKPVGERVVSVETADENGAYSPLETANSYTLITNSYIALGNGYNGVFAEAAKEGRVKDIGLSDWESFAAYLSEAGEVNPQVEGRIVDVAGNSENEAIIVDPADFNGTQSEPKKFEGNIKVNISEVAKLENAVINGNLIITGSASDAFTFSNLKVNGNLDLSGLNGDLINFTGIEVTGDTVL